MVVIIKQLASHFCPTEVREVFAASTLFTLGQHVYACLCVCVCAVCVGEYLHMMCYQKRETILVWGKKTTLARDDLAKLCMQSSQSQPQNILFSLLLGGMPQSCSQLLCCRNAYCDYFCSSKFCWICKLHISDCCAHDSSKTNLAIFKMFMGTTFPGNFLFFVYIFEKLIIFLNIFKSFILFQLWLCIINDTILAKDTHRYTMRTHTHTPQHSILSDVILWFILIIFSSIPENTLWPVHDK